MGVALLIVLGVCVVVVCFWLMLMVLGLRDLRRRAMDEIARVLWVWLVVTVPILGPVAVFIVRPGQERPASEA
ncbi:MAG: hypothetical protein ACUVTZ_07410 [Armatimonadota bacterium]